MVNLLAFSSNSTYQLQADGADASFVRICNASSTPSETFDGEYLNKHNSGIYEPDAAYLYVKREGHPSYLSVSEL